VHETLPRHFRIAHFKSGIDDTLCREPMPDAAQTTAHDQDFATQTVLPWCFANT
jgi:hypothetical protein